MLYLFSSKIKNKPRLQNEKKKKYVLIEMSICEQQNSLSVAHPSLTLSYISQYHFISYNVPQLVVNQQLIRESPKRATNACTPNCRLAKIKRAICFDLFVVQQDNSALKYN